MTAERTVREDAQVRIQTLGAVGIDGWSPDLLRQPKAFAVLVWIGVQGRDGYCRRDAVAAAFWPESSQERARASLRNTLYVLRRHLPTGAIETAGDESVRVAPARVWIDAVEFARAVEARQDEEALELYRGPFLDAVHLTGGEFDAWRDARERTFHREALAAALRMAERHGEDPTESKADAWLERACMLAPLDDAPIRQLLTRFIARGDVAAAATTFAHFERRLEAVELRPAAGTVALIEAALSTSGEHSADVGTGAPARVSHGADDPTPTSVSERTVERHTGGEPPQQGLFSRSHRPNLAAASVAVGLAVGGALLLGRELDSSSGPPPPDGTIEEMQSFVEEGAFAEAHRVAEAIEAEWAGVERFEALWDQATHRVKVTTSQAGSTVSVRDYRGGGWIELGTTPIESVRIPAQYLRWRIQAPDGETIHRAGLDTSVRSVLHFQLPTTDGPEGMAYVSGDALNAGAPRAMRLEPYWLDEREVTNSDFARFVSSEAYPADPLFRDRSGVPGPATWMSGSFAPGEDAHPVTGVSWVEADAYCRWLGKELPTLFHWLGAGGFHAHSDIIDLSNFAGHGPVDVGASEAIGPYGHEDLAGNAREWVANETGGQRYVVGGAWDTPRYLYFTPDAADPHDRSSHNGFRCAVTGLPEDHASRRPLERARTPIRLAQEGVDFEQRAEHFAYDRLPLEAGLDSVSEALPNWRREFVSYQAGYETGRLAATVFLPRHGTPPYPVVVYHPGAEANHLADSRSLQTRWFDFLARAGYAVIHPVYDGTFERRARVAGPIGIRDRGIRRVQDVRRALDYVEERSDLSITGATYYGFSEGGVLAPLVAAIEPRISGAIVLSSGLLPAPLDPVIEPRGYLPEAESPLLMIGGELDFLFPFENSQRSYFEAWGAPAASKRLVALPTGHTPRDLRPIAIEVVDWLGSRH